MMKSSKTKRGIFFGLLCAAMVFAPLAAFAAGQTITIDSNNSPAGYVYGNGTPPYDDVSSLQNINENTVEIQSGGEVTGDVYGGYIAFASGATDASAKDNRVTLNSGGSVLGYIYGGFSGTGASTTGPAHTSGNSVTINGGTAGDYICGGYSFSYGNSADSLNNSVTVTGGTINGNVIYGGYADSDASGMSGVASGNSVVLNGGTITGDLLVYGGYSLVDGYNETGAATGNSVTVGGSLALGGGVLSVTGGFVGDGNGNVPEPGTDAFTGNTFNKDSDVLVEGAANFENVTFGYSGDANIKTLDTTPGGSAQTTVNIDTGNNNVNFNGAITGSGSIDKKGSGELTLTDITGLTGTITLSKGTLKNGTDDAITVSVNGTPQQLAPGESATNNEGDGTNEDGGDVTSEGGGSGGGCNTGAYGLFTILFSLASPELKKRVCRALRK